VLQQGKWFFVNQTLPKMKDLTEDKEIAVKSMVEITDGKKILLSDEEGGRLLLVQMVNG
jgi:hypothetical protein